MSPGDPCVSYRAGHRIHWIQCGHAIRSEPVEVGLVGMEGERLSLVAADGRVFSVWNHDPVAVRAALDSGAPGMLLFPAWGALQIGDRWFSFSSRPGETCHVGGPERPT